MLSGRGATSDTQAALIGTVEELSATSRTQTLVREQFETNFFGPMNIIKAALPAMRKQGNGHVVVLSSISSLYLLFNPHLISPESKLIRASQQATSALQV